jgi:coenzyme F420-0:L-glutamate ligase/coenzyme F420-1:gamma-L-glutamate ligase
MIEIIPIGGIDEVSPGDDLSSMLIDALNGAGLTLVDGDILVITQKVVSKAEDRFVRLDSVEPSKEARTLAAKVKKDPRLVEIVLKESVSIVRAVPGILITRHRLGMVMANAGVDGSNIGADRDGHLLMLPENPDGTAEQIVQEIRANTGVRVATVISDSFGRPWRHGVINVAIGAYGLQALSDRRGDPDRDGRPLEVTQIALADQLASAAGLVAGETNEGIPAVIVRGLKPRGNKPAASLVRPLSEDLFQ